MFDPTYLVGLVVALIAGILLGYLLRSKKHVTLNRVTFGIIIVLIFSLGFSMGSNSALLNSLPIVGLNAVVILLFAMAFSVLFVKVVKKLVKIG